MACKRFLPVLRIQDGRAVDPDSGTDLGEALVHARRLELEGADELLIEAPGPDLLAWLPGLARNLFLPFVLDAPFRDPEAVAEALAAGTDRVLLPAAVLAGSEAFAGFGRTRLVAALDFPGSWDGVMEACRNLDQRGAGGVLLDLGECDQALAQGCAQAAHLPIPLLLRCVDPDLAAEALAQGADGVVYPGHRLGTAAFKRRAASLGLPTRP